MVNQSLLNSSIVSTTDTTKHYSEIEYLLELVKSQDEKIKKLENASTKSNSEINYLVEMLMARENKI